ncbi:TlpA disulfide reductase family protein [Alteromonas halophila]|uniref:Thiol:disulfide interchange protein n=1 Tax=Alteromonas halophila TaxID=516698 RepID=A0A918N1F5_9ALTE|nr:TlpA disulfide reductase family protein [Alteromonas halophila]GGW93495.1 thiol:disulfide interchange protein [Alteromonas halophila]
MSLSLGPLALPLDTLLLFLTLGVFIGATKFLSGRRKIAGNEQLAERATSGIYIAALSALFLARTVFVIRFWSQYSEAPLHILNIRDGGFSASTGYFAFITALLLYCYRHKALLGVYVRGIAVALLVLVPGDLAMTLYKQGKSLPSEPVATLSGDTLSLSAYSGKPMVVNYWASWCPPCRREMPVLEAAQAANDDLHFIFVNQGETASAVATFLKRNRLKLDNVLLDRTRALSRSSGAAGLPTTLFFNRRGKLVDMHMGELSAARLQVYIDKLPAQSALHAQ